MTLIIWHQGKGKIDNKPMFKYVKYIDGFYLWSIQGEAIAEKLRDMNTVDREARKWLENEAKTI